MTEWIAVLMRWGHVGSAMIAIGATLFARMILLPSLPVIDEAGRNALMGRILPRYRHVLWMALLLIIITGVYNYVAVLDEKSMAVDRAYFIVLNIKVLLAVAITVIALMLTVPSQVFAKMQAVGKKWMTVNLILAFILLALGAWLRLQW